MDDLSKKVELTDSGESISELLLNMVQSPLKWYIYNFVHQHSELKYLKFQLGEEEVICSVDYSKNYENKQKHEIQSAHFGMKLSPYLLQHVTASQQEKRMKK